MKLISVLFLVFILSNSGIAQADSTIQLPQQEIENVKSPWLAFGLSCLFPGIGQFYNGQITKAFIMAGLTAGSMALLSTGGTGEIRGDAAGAILILAGTAAIVWLWSMIDAPISANIINRDYRESILNKNLQTKNIELSFKLSF